MQELKGLDAEQVVISRKKFGNNVVSQGKSVSSMSILFSQFTSPVMIVLIVAGILSFSLHGVTDAIVVWMAVVLNGLLGFYQEYRAEKSLEMLEKMVQATAEVMRDGKRIQIPTDEIVIGDIVMVKAGDKIPADAIVLDAQSLALNEAMLTGESAAVVKIETKDDDFEKAGGQHKVYMGTIVVAGLGMLSVRRVGKATEMGKIASSLTSTQRVETELQKEMNTFARMLTKIVVLVAFGLIAVGIMRGMPVREIFLVAVAVAVSAIPEGMVITLTVILSIGMQRLLRRKGLVRKLLAAETLGTVSVVCADKTGTLTKGEMKVVKAEGDEFALAEAGVLGGDMADPIEVAVREWGGKICGTDDEECEIHDWQRVATWPFDPAKKYGMSLSRRNSDSYIIMRGAPEVLIDYCTLSAKERAHWRARIHDLASKGYRLMGIARKKAKTKNTISEELLQESLKKKEMTYLGLVIMEDPVRKDVAAEIAKLAKFGVDFRVITGDFAETAIYVLRQLGIKTEVKFITGAEFRILGSKKKDAAVQESILFARFAPEDKLEVVTILQSHGHKVVMMGDGVNDAPALKRADLGVVVSSASDVAKETADLILLDDSFATVIAGIEEGRSILQRIKRVVRYLLSDSLAEVVVVSLSMLAGLPLPITAAQILWVNLANDTFPAMAMAMDRVSDEAIMAIQPRAKVELLDRQTKTLIITVSAVSGLLVLVLFKWMLILGFDVVYARTVAFAFLGINTLFTVFVIRNFEKPFWETDYLNNGYLIGGVGVGILMQIAAVYWKPLQSLLGTVPITPDHWWLIGFGTLAVILSIELIKIRIHKLYVYR